jgi:hypothetical protein
VDLVDHINLAGNAGRDERHGRDALRRMARFRAAWEKGLTSYSAALFLLAANSPPHPEGKF